MNINRWETTINQGALFGGAVLVALSSVLIVTQAMAHRSGPAHHHTLPAHANEVMKRLFADRMAPESLSAMTGGAADVCPPGGGTAAGYHCENIDLMAFLPLAEIGGDRSDSAANDVWGWTDVGSGREFAIIGRVYGTSFVEVTDPLNPVYLGELPTHGAFGSTWRDIKVSGDHAFIVSEASRHGMQVFDLTQLLDVTDAPATLAETAHYDKFSSAHNIVINEETGFAYVVGAHGKRSCSGGLHMVDIVDPASPSFAGCYANDGYIVDAQCIIYEGPDTDYHGKEICFASNADTLTVVDVTDKSAVVKISRTSYHGVAYAQQGWLTEDQSHFLLSDALDEQDFDHDTRTRVFDVSDLNQPVIAAEVNHETGAIDHNIYTRGRYAFVANFRSGLRILDVSDPRAPASAGHFDIFPSDDAPQFNGAWSVYPYFPSGTVLVSGIEQGLFVLRPTFADWPPPEPEGQPSAEDQLLAGDSTSPEDPSSPELEPENLHLGEITGQTTEQPNGVWLATVTVTVHDADENLEEGVSVDGSWSTGDSGSCTTDSAGQCAISLSPPETAASITFTVDRLSRDGDSYAAASNHVSGTVALDAPLAPAESDQPLHALAVSAPEIYWSADHETGNFSQWGSISNSGTASNVISTEQAHSGTRSAKLTITAPPQSGTRLGMRGKDFPSPLPLLPDTAYYSVWYYFPQVVTVSNFWNVFQWKQAKILSDGSRTTVPVYVVDVRNRTNGNMAFNLRKNVGTDGGYKTGGNGIIARAPMDIPVKQWVHLECLYTWATDETGQVRCWQDGRELWNATGYITEFDEPEFVEAKESNRNARSWSVNNYSDATKPSTQSIYVDDAAITRERVHGHSVEETPPQGGSTPENSKTLVFKAAADTFLREAKPSDAKGSATFVNVDSDDPRGTGKEVHGLLRFNLIGTGRGLIPPGSTIQSASLTLQTTGAGDGAKFHRMRVSWPESATWKSLGAGIQADGVEAQSWVDFKTGAMRRGSHSFDVKAAVQKWANGAPNHGWALLPLGKNGWDFYSREGKSPPQLSVTFVPPK